MMSYLALSYMSLTAGGSLEVSAPAEAVLVDLAERFSRNVCRSDAGWSLLSFSLIDPLSCPAYGPFPQARTKRPRKQRS